jgi:DNA-binding NtrC family response regulator
MTALRILVVDDDALIGLLLADMLTSMGHAVCGVESTEEGAVAAAARLKPNLMIVDARLGDGSGLAAVARVLADGPMPHVFISGGRIAPRTPGAVTLQKPFVEQALAYAIARALAASPQAPPTP